jgi:hypothetical protein
MRVLDGEAVAPFGAGVLVLRARPDLEWSPWARDVIAHRTHDLLIRCPRTGTEVEVAYGQRFKDRKGKPYVRANLGRVPMLFEDAGDQRVTCKVGYRRTQTK